MVFSKCSNRKFFVFLLFFACFCNTAVILGMLDLYFEDVEETFKTDLRASDTTIGLKKAE